MNNLLEQYSSGWLGDGADCQKLCRGCSARISSAKWRYGAQGWRIGGTQGWRIGGTRGWRIGGTQGWRIGGTQGWRIGGTQGWRIGGTRGWLLCHIGWQYAQLAGDAAGLTGWQKRAPKLRSNNRTTDQATKNPAGAGVQLTRACFPAPAGQNHIKLS